MFGSGATTLMFSNEEINNIMEIIRPLEESSLLIRSLGETIKNEAKEQKWGFLSMLLGTLSATLLENILADKGTIGVDKFIIRAGLDFVASSRNKFWNIKVLPKWRATKLAERT